MNPYLFREYDIRGSADLDLTDGFVTDLGRALGTYFYKKNARRIALGRDCRLHSPRIRQALVQGILSTGVHLIDIGIVPTPALYFTVFHQQLDGGIQITGSHNPTSDNGFKIMDGKNAFFGEHIQKLRCMIETKDFYQNPSPGTITPWLIHEEYLRFATSRLQMGQRRFKVVVDAGNGTGGVFLVPLLRSLGFEVVELFCDMDGSFPNHHPDPSVPENLQALCTKVKLEKAEIGLALDGDADRLGAVDGQGRMVFGDELLLLLAKAVLKEAPGATILGEVKCSQSVYDEIEKAGGTALMWRVGHSLLKEKMKEVGAALAGELSGHLFFAHRYLGYDDAIYAGARLIEMLSKSSEPFSFYVSSLPKRHNLPEGRRPVAEQDKFEIVERAKARFRSLLGVRIIDIDGVRVHFQDAWALVRASNTQPALVTRYEAETEERLQQIKSWLEAEIVQIEQEITQERISRQHKG